MCIVASVIPPQLLQVRSVARLLGFDDERRIPKPPIASAVEVHDDGEFKSFRPFTARDLAPECRECP